MSSQSKGSEVVIARAKEELVMASYIRSSSKNIHIPFVLNELCLEFYKKCLEDTVDQLYQFNKQIKSNSTKELADKLLILFNNITTNIIELNHNSNTDKNIMNKIIDICCDSFLILFDEKFKCVKTIASYIGNEFGKYISMSKIQNLLFTPFTVKMSDDPNIETAQKNAAILIGNMYKLSAPYLIENPYEMQQFTDKMVSTLITVLINNNVVIHIKQDIINCMNDIMIGYGAYGQRYYADILEKCLRIGELTPPKNADDDMVNCFNRIRYSIMNISHTCLVQLVELNSVNGLEGYVPKLFTNFKSIDNDKRVNDDVILSSIKCIKLLSEHSLLTYTPNIINILNKAKKSNNQQLKEIANTTLELL
eukprot:515409_1